jgi:hypothetical protein
VYFGYIIIGKLLEIHKKHSEGAVLFDKPNALMQNQYIQIIVFYAAVQPEWQGGLGILLRYGVL